MASLLYIPKSSAKPIVTAWILFLGLALAQYPDDARNCTAGEIDPHPGQVSYRTLNATGSYEFKAFGNPSTIDPAAKWTWSIGVQNIWNFTNNIAFWYEQPVWVDTRGTDLASDEVDYEMCYLALSDFPLSMQRNGEGDSGDCTKFFNLQCVDDWRKALTDQGLKYMRDNSTDRKLPCEALRQFTPESCKNFKGSTRMTGEIPSPNRTCPFGLGSPDYDTVLRLSRFTSTADTKGSAADLRVYDEVVTSILPVFALAWSTKATVGWSDARIMCLSTGAITDGSRTPPGVPSLSSRLRVDVFTLLVSGILALVFL